MSTGSFGATHLTGLTTALASRYRLECELGSGGMATVWLAHDLRHERRVAIKVLRPDLAAELGAERFLREIALTASLQHPHILPLFDSGSADGQLWYVMPYVEGETLRARLVRERQLPLGDVLRIATEVADALQHAHARGVIHRDVKPENILLHGGHALVADFGIALALEEAGGPRITQTGLSLGTPQYMAPEQAAGERTMDARVDVYALGAVTYEMLAGEPPFTGPTAQVVIARSLTEEPRPLTTQRRGIPAHVEDAVQAALAKVPADRFDSAARFAAALGGAGAVDAPRAIRRRSGRRRAIAFAVAAPLAVAALGWLAVARRDLRGHPDPEVAALYQRGMRGYDRRTPASVAEAVRAFEGALARDSGYAPAWSGLAKAYVRAYERGFPIRGVAPDSMIPLAIAALDRAVALDGQNADTWTTRGIIDRNTDPTDVTPALRALRRAVTSDSTSAAAWHYLALSLAETGDLAAAMTAWRRSVAADPSYTQGLMFMAQGHYWAHRFDSAAFWVDSTLAIDPNFLSVRQIGGYVELERGDHARAVDEFAAARRVTTGVEVANMLAGQALAEARAGRRDAARATLRRADSVAAGYLPPTSHIAVWLAQAHAAVGDVDGALAWLGRFDRPRDLHFQLHLRCDAPFDPIAKDPHFRALLTRPRPPAGAGC